MPRNPISPKAHGAWLGAGTGQAIAGVVVGLIQTYVTHATLATPAVQSIYIVISSLLALTGAYILPSGQRPVAAGAAAYGTGGAGGGGGGPYAGSGTVSVSGGGGTGSTSILRPARDPAEPPARGTTGGASESI